MKILLVHRNFPGQFRYLAPALIRKGHKVGVLTWADNPNPQTLPHVKYQHKMRATRGLTGTFESCAELGAAAAATAERMRNRGEIPDVVFGSIGWGETLFLKEVWPEARHLGYAEFCYHTKGYDVGFDPEYSRSGLNANMRTLARRAHIIQAAIDADALLCPTQFQASSFPPDLRPKISVIHDGVDTAHISPNPAARYQVPNGPLLTSGDEVLTFVNRNLEPYRGYHTFMRALPKLLAARPQLQVVIVGSDQVGYGPSPGNGRSWREVILDEVKDKLDLSRIHFVGRIPYEQLLDLLRVGRAHAYLTYPFVLSWSMLEAMALGCLVVGSATPPVQEVIKDGENGYLVDFFDHDAWADKLIEVMSDPTSQEPIRAAARQHIIDSYDLKSVCLPKLIEFVENRA